MSLQSIFVGVPQSKYAGLAVVFAIIAVSVSILFGKDHLPLGQKIAAIALLILVSVPGVLYSLFQLTCLVSGAGFRNQRWWCSVYAWIISALLIVYSILLIAIAILSVFTGSKVVKDLTNYNVEKFENSMAVASQLAGNYTASPSTNPDVVSSTSVSGMVGNGNTATENVLSYSSSVLPVNSVARNTDSANNANASSGGAETFSGTQTCKILAATETSHPFPYDDGTMNPYSVEKFGGSIGDPNNSKQTIGGGGHDDPAPYPFSGAQEGHGWEPLGGPDLPPGA
jgi:hypothetical protein